MVMRSVGFQLRTDGKAEVKNDFAEVRVAGEASMSGVAEAAEQAGERAARASETFADRQIAAWKRQAAAVKIASAAQSNRADIDAALAGPTSRQFATVNLDRTTGAARASADVFQELFKQEEAAAAAATKLRLALDPLFVAEQRLAVELGEINLAKKAGILTDEQLAVAEGLARRRYDETTDALRRQEKARFSLSQMQRQTMIYTASDIVASAASGISPAMIAMQQGPQVLQAFAAEEGGIAKLTAALTGTAAAVAAVAAVVVVGGAAWLTYANATDRAEALSMGAGRVIGLTAEKLEDQANAAARTSEVSVSGARDIITSFVQMGGIGSEVLGGLAALTVDFAKATGKDAAGAINDLGTAFQNPADGADMLAQRYGALTQAQVEHIKDLVEQNDLYGAQQAMLQALQPQFDGAAEHANALARAWYNIKIMAADAWTAMGKAIDRALGGGTTLERINQISQDRAKWLQRTGGYGDTSSYDKQIADLQAQLRQQQTAGARSRAVGAMKSVDGIVGEDTVGGLRQKLSAVNGLLADNGRAAGLTAEQVGRARQAQEMLTHAVTTYLPEGEKQVRLAKLDADIAGAKKDKDRGRVAALTAQRAEVENSGKLMTAAQAEAEATARGTKAKLEGANASDRHGQSAIRQAQSMEVNARAALDVADAYLKSSAAGFVEDARRKAATDATRKGIDVEAQARRQLAVQIADGAVAGAKSVAQLREETIARDAVLERVKAGTLGVDAMNDALSDEAALRPLLKLQTLAHGDALETLNRIIAEYRKGLDDAHRSESEFGLARALQDSIDKAEELKAAVGDLSHSPLDAAMNAANRAANQEADRLKLAPGSKGRTELVRAREDEARQGYLLNSAKFEKSTLDAQEDSIALAQRELELAGASDSVRARELEKMRLELSIRRQYPELAAKMIPITARNIDLQDRINTKLKITAASINEVRQFGGAFVDTVLSPDTWSDWGNAGKRITAEIRSEFIKLALLNPLKNLINGDKALPTLGSVLGVLGKLGGALGGGSGGQVWDERPMGVPDSILTPSQIPKFATGTDSAPGGLAMVGELGPEIVNLPRGSRVNTAAATRGIVAAANDTGPAIHMPITIDATGADAAALGRVEAKIDQLQRTLPGTIVAVYNEARARRVVV